jgi:putative transposase
LTLDALLELTKSTVSPDDIFAMIATQVLHVDLRSTPLAESSRVNVFPTPEAASMAGQDGSRKGHAFWSGILHCGSTITWDGRIWKLVNVGETSVGLLCEDQRLTELPIAVVESLIRIRSQYAGHTGLIHKIFHIRHMDSQCALARAVVRQSNAKTLKIR